MGILTTFFLLLSSFYLLVKTIDFSLFLLIESYPLPKLNIYEKFLIYLSLSYIITYIIHI